MIEAKSSTPQPATTGAALFTSYDGLRAEGSGTLGFLTFETKFVELRSSDILKSLPSPSSSGLAIFAQLVSIDGEKHRMIGVARRIKDFNGRPGVVGAAVGLPNGQLSFTGLYAHLVDNLFPVVEEAMSKQWGGKPLPEKLNLLKGVPRKERRADYRMKQKTKFLHIAEGDVAGFDELMAASFALLGLPNQFGRVLVSPVDTPNSTPADASFISSVENAVRKSRKQIEKNVKKGPQPTEIKSTQSLYTGDVSHERKHLVDRAENSSHEQVNPDEPGQGKAHLVTLDLEEISRQNRILAERVQRIERHLGITSSPKSISTIGNRLAPNIVAGAFQVSRTHLIVFGLCFATVFFLAVSLWILADDPYAPELGLPKASPNAGIPFPSPDIHQRPTISVDSIDCSKPKNIQEETLCRNPSNVPPE